MTSRIFSVGADTASASPESGPLPSGMRSLLSAFIEEFDEPDEPGDADAAAVASSAESKDSAPAHPVPEDTCYPSVDVPWSSSSSLSRIA